MSDVNINTLCAQTCNCVQQFLDCLQSYALFPTIEKPKRVYNNSPTLMGNIFTNTFCEYFVSGNIVSDVADHLSQSNSTSFSLLLKQLSLSKLEFKTTQNNLSRDSYGISLKYIGNLFFLGAMSISYSLILLTS